MSKILTTPVNTVLMTFQHPIKKILFFLMLTIFSCSSFAQTTQFASPFTNNMVLQRNTSAKIWGSDAPNAKVSIITSWNNKSYISKSDNEGKWSVLINTPEGSETTYTVTLQGSETVTLTNVLIGEVWICSGQSNMEMPVKGFFNQPVYGSNEAILNATNNNIRLFTVERNPSLIPLDDVKGEWLCANPLTVKEFSAVGYFFGRKINSLLNIPIGLIHTSWGASNIETWMDEQTLSEFKEVEIVKEITSDKPQKLPVLLYNGMLHPLQNYAIKGTIWYQGESNSSDATEYSKLFPAMIKQWRKQWQQGDFPFYFVQIAPFGSDHRRGNSAYLREAQLKTMQTVRNTGMAVTLDIGNCDFIHPPEKRIVGERLAYWALAKDYNFEGVACSGPVYKNMEKKDEDKINLYFDYCPIGITSFGKPLLGFEIAGEDKVFYPATATIDMRSTGVTVFSDKVKNPVAVRYAFEHCPTGTLFNIEGLPASSFRTDDWDIVTQVEK